MSLRINFNSAAMTAHRNLGATDNATARSIEKLSSGFKINSAGDDPAGLVISEKLRAQVTGLGQAIKNGGDAVNMVKTAEGALTQVNSLLRSMRDLAVHAANTGANDAAALAADQAQITNALASINKIATETQFGNKKLLDGSAGIKAAISGTAVTGVDLQNTSGLATGDQIGVNVTQVAQKATLSSAAFATTGTAVTDAAGSFSMYINGVAVSYNSTTTVSAMRTAINAVTSQTGVVASGTTGIINLDTNTYGASASVAITSGSGIMSAASVSDTGQNALATISKTGGATIGGTWNKGDGLVIKDELGNQIVLAEAANTVADKGMQASVAVGTLTFQVGAYANQTRELNIGSIQTQYMGTATGGAGTLAGIDVTTQAGAQSAMQKLDEAISSVSTMRANLGATQKNVLESSIASLSIAKENIAASESSIRDTDMADEMVNFTKNNIMQQAGISMLSQANQSSQALLSLLR